MYKKPIIKKSQITFNKSTEGETIEIKMERIIANKEKIKDGAPLIYTERKEGVRASTNIRTNRWEVAVEGADKIAKSYQARREERQKPPVKTEPGGSESAKTEPTQGNQQAPK